MMRKRLTTIAVLVLVVSLVFPGRVAFGLDIWPDGSFWSGVTYSGTYGSFIRASNKYDAAVYAIGEDPNRLSDEVKAKLSDPNYGGNFYSYASEFYNVTSFDSIPGFVPTYVVFTLTGIFHTWERVFAAETTIALRDAALVDFRRILAGEDLSEGGGSDVEEESGFYYFGGPSHYVTGWTSANQYLTYNGVRYTNLKQYFNTSGYSPLPSPLLLRVTKGLADKINTAFPYSDNKWFALLSLYEGYPSTMAIYAGSNAVVEHATQEVEGIGTVEYISKVTFPNGGAYYSWAGTGDGYSSGYSFDGSLLTQNKSGYPFGNYKRDMSAGTSIVAGTFDIILTSDYEGYYSPAAPDGDWPENETPTTPTAPEIPTPTAPTIPVDPTVTDPTVTWPDINITVEPAPVVVTETPSGLDYTDLLTRINDNLISLDAYTKAINSDLNSLRADLLTGFDGLVQGLRNIYQYLQHLDDLLERHCKHIRDSIDENVYELELYLKGLFEWLPEQLNFDASFDYDDSGVIGWLKKIYLKLGGGTSAPNPVADPGGFFSWLLGLIMGFLASLLAGLPDKVQELLTDLSDLTGYFPFSAPWDLYALLALFAHDPVTPVISIPWGLGSDNTVNVVVDCTPWNGVMSIVREVEKVIFAGGLARFTFELFKPTDVLGD